MPLKLHTTAYATIQTTRGYLVCAGRRAVELTRAVNQLLVYYRAPSDARISRCDTFADLGRLREKIHARHAVLAARVSTPGSTVPERTDASP